MAVFAKILAEFNPQGIQDAETAFGRLSKTVTGALSTAAIVNFGKAMVDAAMDDEAAQRKLAISLRNVTGATEQQIAATEEFINRTQMSTGVLDDQLRPALATLVRSTKDTAEAQDLLAVAIDVSVGTGRDLETVSLALARAHDGNTTALGRMGIATKDANGDALAFDQVMQNLSSTFTGQAAAAMETAEGKMRLANISFTEAKENLGNALIPVLGDLAGAITPIIDGFSALPDEVRNVIVIAGLAFVTFKSLSTTMQGLGVSAGTANKALGAIGLGLAAVAVIGKIFAASSESNTEETEAFTAALRENDVALRANRIREIAAEEPAVRGYLETLGQLGLTIDDLSQYLKDGSGPAAFYREQFSMLANSADPLQIKIGRLNAEMGVQLDLTEKTPAELERLWSGYQNLQFALFNAEQAQRNNTDATDAAASALVGVALEGEDAAEAFDEVTGSLYELTEEWKTTLGWFDNKTAFNNIIEQFGKVTEAGVLAFGEPSQENLFNYEEELANLYGDVGKYIEQLDNVPPAVQTEILAALDAGQYETVKRLLGELTADRTLTVGVEYVDIETRRMLNLQKRAMGGAVASMTPYIVGEQGPELFVPNMPGQIIPNHELAAASTRTASANAPIIVNVAGSIISERDLVESVRVGLLKAQKSGRPIVL